MKLSLIIVSRSISNCRALLASLDQSAPSEHFEVIISWNGAESEISEVSRLSKSNPRIEPIAPYHFAANNNKAAALAKGEILGFVNDDIVLDPGSVDAAVQCFEHPSIGIVGGRLRYGDGRLQHVGVYFREDGTPYHLDKLTNNYDSPQHRVSRFVPAVTGAYLFVRRSEFEKLKFDENYQVAGEDIDLCLRYRLTFDREIYFCADATAVHLENITRKQFGQRDTPKESLERLRTLARQRIKDHPIAVPRHLKVSIKTEKPGWIMHRQATEIRDKSPFLQVDVNGAQQQADIAYYINYGYFEGRKGNEIVVANFTHFDPSNLAEKFKTVALECDHCVAVSNSTLRELIDMGVPASRITVIENGADASFEPKAVIGIVGRTYGGGRKGEDLVAALLQDPDIGKVARIVASSQGWGAPVWSMDDPADFYHAIDLLLVPSRREGGPVPFFEALACGKLAIAPEIGAIPDYPHISYRVGDYESLKNSIIRAATEIVKRRQIYSRHMRAKNWFRWASEHELLFRDLIREKNN